MTEHQGVEFRPRNRYRSRRQHRASGARRASESNRGPVQLRPLVIGVEATRKETLLPTPEVGPKKDNVIDAEYEVTDEKKV
ncbi:MAG: hypothetical protein F2849_05385 [Actinobacteria bacterium]|nr:hypothetical protein [Actinomycetota bacterium]